MTNPWEDMLEKSERFPTIIYWEDQSIEDMEADQLREVIKIMFKERCESKSADYKRMMRLFK